MCILEKYQKPWRSFEAQARQLEKFGLEGATDYVKELNRIGYYRLSGYWYPLRVLEEGNERRIDFFYSGSRFEDVLKIYEFDHQLRKSLFEAICRIEVAIRVELGYVIGERDKFGHLNIESLDTYKPASAHKKFLSRYHSLQSRSGDDFVKHFNRNYLGVLPVWVATEILQFGELVMLFEICHYDDRRKIAESLGGLDADQLLSWLRAIKFVRNVCAHHGRVWNRSIVSSPKWVSPEKFPALSVIRTSHHHIYGVIACIVFLLRHYDYLDEIEKLRVVLEGFPESEHFQYSMMGMSDEWAKDQIWSD